MTAKRNRPSVLYRPALMADGNMWCALYGKDAQSGVAAFGETPEKAMEAFDEAWATLAPPKGGLPPEPARRTPSSSSRGRAVGKKTIARIAAPRA